MMKQILVVIAALVAKLAIAHPISMEYEVSPIGPDQYEYTFYLTCDVSDPQFTPGNGWSWLIFGDRFLGTSPIDNFVGDPSDLPIGPWTSYASSGGGHNGPTLGFVLDPWYPTGTQTLVWSGIGDRDLAQGFLKFSFLIGYGNAPFVDFFTAYRRDPGGRQYCLGGANLLDFAQVSVRTGLQASIEIRELGTSNVLHSTTASLDWSGKWIFEIDPSLPPGDYTFSLKTSHWLRKNGDFYIGEGGVAEVILDQINGDADPDNEVNLLDSAAVSAAFGSISGDPNWNPMSDLDGDGEVNLVDYSIVSANFGLAGDE